MIDNSKARGLQEIYKAGRREALEPLAAECERIAHVLVKATCRRYGLRFDREQLEEFAHDAAAQFIAQYLKHADYSVRSFSGRIRRDVLNVMFGRARNRQDAFEDAQLQLDDSHNNIAASVSDDGPARADTALAELVAEHPKGKRIASDLYQARGYAQAIRRIAGYVERGWIREHATKLRQVFETLHWRPSEAGRVPRASSRGVSGAVRKSGQGERKQRDQRPGPMAEGGSVK